MPQAKRRPPRYLAGWSRLMIKFEGVSKSYERLVSAMRSYCCVFTYAVCDEENTDCELILTAHEAEVLLQAI